MAGERVFSRDDVLINLGQKPNQALLYSAHINPGIDKIVARAQVDNLGGSNHRQFEGHAFGGGIVIPGVATVKMTADLARLWGFAETGENNFVIASGSANFRGVLSPEDQFVAELTSAGFVDGKIDARGQVIIPGEKRPATATGLTLARYNLTNFPVPSEGLTPLSFSKDVLYRGTDLDEFLPQVPPFRLVDVFRYLQPGVRGVGDLVDTSDPALQWMLFQLGGETYVDPNYLIEGPAQIGTGVARSMEQNKGLVPLFRGIRNLKIHHLLRPGDRAQMEVVVTRFETSEDSPGGLGRGNATVTRYDGLPILSTELSFVTVDPKSLRQAEN